MRDRQLRLVTRYLGAAGLVVRLGERTLAALAFGGIGIAAGSLVGLLLSERVALFGFQETGYRSAIVLSIALDVAAILLLATFLAMPFAVNYHRS